jgi:anti-anti-sigma factor
MHQHTLAYAFDDASRILTVTGDVDVEGALALRREVFAHSADEIGSVTMDLSQVTALSGAAVGVMASTRAEMRSRFWSLTFVAKERSVARDLLPTAGMTVFDPAAVRTLQHL